MDKSNKPIYIEPNSLSLPDKETLNPDMLRLFDIGSSRVCEYFQHNNIDMPYKVNRSEKNVSLTRILVILEDRKAALKKAIDAAMSITEDELSKAIDKTRAGHELQNLIDKLNMKYNSRRLVNQNNTSNGLN